MKVIRIYGYIHRNFGDDLMISILLDRYKKCNFFLGYEPNTYEYGDSDIFLKYKNFENMGHFYQKWGRMNHIFNILTFYRCEDFFYKWMLERIERKTVCSVYIGGSLYQQNSSCTTEEMYLRESKKLKDKPLFIIGANFGPYIDKNCPEKFHSYFSQCRGVCFRDRSSYNLFSGLSQVKYAPDVVFNYRNKKKVIQNNTVVISVIDFQMRDSLKQYTDVYEKFIIKICNESIKRNMIPVLMSFCPVEGDEEAINRIYDRLDKKVKLKTKKHFYKEMEPAITIISQASHIIATRFHSMILAIKFGIPFFCIAYNPKNINVLQDLKCDAFCLPEDLKQDISMNTVFDKPKFGCNVEEYIRQAEGQFEQLDLFIKEKKA